MEKTIKLDSKTSLRVTNNVSWMMVYHDQFGHDIVPALVPILNGFIDIAVDLAKATGGETLNKEVILKALETDTLREALFDMAGLEMVDVINIVWAMARALNDDIEEPREWAKSLPAFPLDVIIPIVGDMVLRCMVSTKNLKRLQEALKILGPSQSSPSS